MAGVSDTIALADSVVFATLVAVTMTVWLTDSEAGAVYTPVDERVPTDGLSDQVTALFAMPDTVAMKLCVCDTARETFDGDNEMVACPML